ncbi:hypothetical protein AWENTII_005172 [Aspergillus wentii]
MRMKKQVLDALNGLSLPQKMSDVYRAYAEGFESLEELIERQIAQRTMALLTHNTGSMSKEVLLTALSLDSNGEVDQTTYQDLTDDPSLIVQFCNHLVYLNESLGVFQFYHTTIFEFFSKYKTATYNYRIAELCLSHICSSEFSQGPRRDATWYSPGSLGPILQKSPFLLFAAHKWATSIKKSFNPGATTTLETSHSTVLDLIKVLCDEERAAGKKENLQLAFQVHLLSLGRTMPAGVCPVHVVSYFGLVSLFGIFRKQPWFDLTRPDQDGLRPIHWTIRNETDLDDIAPTVERLIEYGAEVNVADNQGCTPLHYAAYFGNKQVVQMLVDNQARIDPTDRNNETALIAACRKHHEDVVLYLVKAGADVKILSSFGTALQVVSLVGCCSCAQEILNRYGKSKMIENGGPFGTSLHTAAFYGHSNLVKLLCSRKQINPRATHGTYGSPVTAAATGFNPGVDSRPFQETIDELIRHGVKVNDQSGVVGPALRAAAYHGNPDLVRLLLNKGAKVRKAKGPMGTAYEAADDRGHEEVKKILLESDPKAANYGGAHASQTSDRQQIQRKVFRATVKTSSMDTINNLITQFEKFFEREIPKGETTFLKGLAKLDENAFQDVIQLATNSRDNVSSPTRESSGIIARLRRFMSNLWCKASKSTDEQPAGPVDEKPHHLRKATTTFVQGGVEEHFPKVLDRMTQAAVKILENAIASKDRAVIRLIANTWTEALNNLVSYPGFGESMLQMVVQKRANELKGHLTNVDLSPEERLAKAEALARVGIELLLMAVERGQKFKHLSFVICKLWIEALSNVEDLGKEGEAPIRELIRIFCGRFSNAVMIQDQVNAEICAQAGIELMRAAALSARIKLLDNFGKEWVTTWGLAVDNMGYMTNLLMNQRLKEYQDCFMDKKHDEALSLILAGIGVLCTAIKHRASSATSTLQPLIELGFQSTLDGHVDHDIAGESVVNCEVFRALDLRAIFDALVRLFATGAEDVQPNRFNALASKIMDLIGMTSEEHHRMLKEVADQHIEEASKTVHFHDRETQLIEVSRTILVLLDVELCAEEPNAAIVRSLKELASRSLSEISPDSVKKDELSIYPRAIGYLEQEQPFTTD